ncbi:Spindle pole body component [Pleurotus pulmonarius]
MNLSRDLEFLVDSVVPQARDNDGLRDELTQHCQDILRSHIGQNYDPDLGHLTTLVKRHLLQHSPSGSSSVKFTNLLSRLLDQSVLTRKHAAILFLHSLASSQPSPPSQPAFLPSLDTPPSRQSSSHAPKTPIDVPNGTTIAKGKGKSRAQILSEYRAKMGRPPLPEQHLLRDALYLLQGISGKHVHFSSHEDNGTHLVHELSFVTDPKYEISEATKALIHRLSEVGYLYNRVQTYVKERENVAEMGMIEQSLCHHLQARLTDYYRFIAVLESQMSGALTSDSPNAPEEEIGLTLRRLDVWINDWRLRMRMMSVCVESARDSHGGALVNIIHGYTENGDPFVRKFTDQLLEDVSKPFFATLHKWLFSGELYDPYLEFFVAMDPSLAHMQYAHPSSLSGGINQLSSDGGFAGPFNDGDDMSGDREGGLKLWEAKYKFQKEMLPMFVGETFGRKIFSTGKSLNFIRYSCHDSDWVATREKMNNTGGSLKYSDIAGLERSIDAAYQVASGRLFDVFLDKFKLLDHLRALRQYLLLGHGDFADQLMEALAPSLRRPANTLYRHNLTATLETAIRCSNAQHDSQDVLRRLDARMLEYSHGEIGWDVFTLEYKIDAPLDTVVDPESMVKYLQLFSHLWQMKRLEGVLSIGWMRASKDVESFLRIADLEQEWHRIRLASAEMLHFVRQMQAYSQLEVIECSWKDLCEFLQKKEGDLDAMIDAHRSYLDRMVKKMLLVSPKAGKEYNVLNQVKEVFNDILQFRDAMDTFYNHCLSESARRDRGLDAERGVITGLEDDSDKSQDLLKVYQKVKEYSSSFSDRVHSIVQSLQSHSDLDVRFMGTRLNFSDFYRSKREHPTQRGTPH